MSLEAITEVGVASRFWFGFTGSFPTSMHVIGHKEILLTLCARTPRYSLRKSETCPSRYLNIRARVSPK